MYNGYVKFPKVFAYIFKDEKKDEAVPILTDKEEIEAWNFHY